jgi:transcriptional regulator GlxA family with amidase domain
MSRKLLRIQSWGEVAREAKFQPATMASLCSVSLRQLQRHFKTHFGTTPRQWARDLRWQLAQKLIGAGCSNKWVVAELGFTDNAHLCREFKKLCGATPQSHAPGYAVAKNTAAGRAVAFLQYCRPFTVDFSPAPADRH